MELLKELLTGPMLVDLIPVDSSRSDVVVAAGVAGRVAHGVAVLSGVPVRHAGRLHRVQGDPEGGGGGQEDAGHRQGITAGSEPVTRIPFLTAPCCE